MSDELGRYVNSDEFKRRAKRLGKLRAKRTAAGENISPEEMAKVLRLPLPVIIAGFWKFKFREAGSRMQ